MLYADYDYYTTCFYGHKITDEKIFNGLAFKASAFLDAITFGRIIQGAPADDAVKSATCAVADVMFGYEEGTAGIASESVGRVSITYAAAEDKTLEGECYAAAYPFLANTGLLYRGVR